MFRAISDAFKIPELRKKILYTMMMIVVFRIGTAVPVPGINTAVIKQLINQQAGFLSFYDIVAGGALSNFTVFALSVGPYITSSIIIQLLAVAIPSLEEMQKSGEDGRKKIMAITRYLTVALALIQSTALGIGFFRQALLSNSILNQITVVATLTAGSAFLVWVGEQITEKGVGNGISILIFAGIVSRIPRGAIASTKKFMSKELSIVQVVVFLVLALAIIIGVIMVLEATRKIPVQYAKRVVGNRTYGGQSSHIPVKINQGGVIPVIFASSVLMMPQVLTIFVKNPGYIKFVNKWLTTRQVPGSYVYIILSFLLIIFFTYFYMTIIFKPDEIAKDLKNAGGFIPGVRPGKATEDYIFYVSNRLTLVGAVFLALIAAVPMFILNILKVPFYFGGTSLLIVVGVALETMKMIEAQMVMRHYKGFLK